MDYIKTSISKGIAIVVISRGKVNALNRQVVEELRVTLEGLKNDPSVRAVVLTGQGKFFSFGFDIPEFLPYGKQEFTDYLVLFTDLYAYMFLYPKPLIAGLNGHAIAGGCMLALACDKRIMATGGAKISLNEIRFGSTVFFGSVELLRFWLGNMGAREVLFSGAMYAAEEAKALGLIDELAAEGEVMSAAMRTAIELGEKPDAAFADIKLLLRGLVVQRMRLNEKDSIDRFIEIWYSDRTRENLKNIKIH